MTAPVVEANPQPAGQTAVFSNTASVRFLASILLLMFVMNTLGRGVTETFAVFLLPVQKGLGVARAEITATYSIYMLVFGLTSPLAGQLVDRMGVRISYCLGLARFRVWLLCGRVRDKTLALLSDGWRARGHSYGAAWNGGGVVDHGALVYRRGGSRETG
jgi:MFS family permease